MFGSMVRGEGRTPADIDLLVIKAGDYHHIEVAQRIYRAIGGRDFAVDITVATPEEVERYKDEYGLILYTALRKGRVVYDAEAA